VSRADAGRSERVCTGEVRGCAIESPEYWTGNDYWLCQRSTYSVLCFFFTERCVYVLQLMFVLSWASAYGIIPALLFGFGGQLRRFKKYLKQQRGKPGTDTANANRTSKNGTKRASANNPANGPSSSSTPAVEGTVAASHIEC
jgi:hypothetical protein